MFKIYLKLTLTMLFWGGTFVSGRMLAGRVPPLTAAFLRFTLASAVLLVVLYWKNGGLPPLPRRMVLPVFCLSLTGVFSYNVLFFWGLQTVPASRAAVIIANNPVFIAALAGLIFHERLGLIASLGIPVSVAGAVIAISRGDVAALWQGGLGWGDLMILGCVASWMTFSLIGKAVVAHVRPLTAVSYAAAMGAVLLSVPSVLSGLFDQVGAYTLFDWGNLAFLGIFGTALGFVWYYEGIERIGAARAGLFINLVPLSAIALSFFLLSEPVTMSLLVGVALVLTGVYFTNRRPVKKCGYHPR